MKFVRLGVLGLAIASSCGGKTTSSRAGAQGGNAGSAGTANVVCVAGSTAWQYGAELSVAGCYSCTCGANGKFDCVGIDCFEGSCEFRGRSLNLGQSMPNPDDLCSSCTCGPLGVVCATAPCRCRYGDTIQDSGSTFTGSDGCSRCVCTNGAVECDPENCQTTCSYAGQVYPDGALFPGSDGCNTCRCASRTVACTSNPCACNPLREHYRRYLALAPADCVDPALTCAPNTKAFVNDCGCGCEEDASCPEYFACNAGATSAGGNTSSAAGAAGSVTSSAAGATGSAAGAAGSAASAAVAGGGTCPTPDQRAQCPFAKELL